MPDPRILVALDFATATEALALVDRLSPALCRLKIGKELFTAAGPQLVETLVARGFDIFLDLKFHDIPNTVAHACQVAARLGVWMVDVHALGGRRMMEAALDALANETHRPKLIAVTLLTSMQATDLLEVGLSGTPEQNVLRLATLARDSSLDGVVCSAQEAAALRAALGPRFALVTPGIRLAGNRPDDQARVTTPADAVRLGSDYLVIGRPITRSADPLATLQQIDAELQSLMTGR